MRRVMLMISSLPVSVRWRYTLRPVWLRVAISRVWPGRWSDAELEQIKARAMDRWLALQSCVVEGDDGER